MAVTIPTPESVELLRLHEKWTREFVGDLKRWCEKIAATPSCKNQSFFTCVIGLLEQLDNILAPNSLMQTRVHAKELIEKNWLPALLESIDALSLDANDEASDVVHVLSYFVAFQQVYYKKHQNVGTDKLSSWDNIALDYMKQPPFEMNFEKIADLVKKPVEDLIKVLQLFNEQHPDYIVEVPDEKSRDCLKYQKLMMNDFLSHFLHDIQLLLSGKHSVNVESTGTKTFLSLLQNIVEQLQIIYSLNPFKTEGDRLKAKKSVDNLFDGIELQLQTWRLEEERTRMAGAMLKYLIAFKQIVLKNVVRQPEGAAAGHREKFLWSLRDREKMKPVFASVEARIEALITKMSAHMRAYGEMVAVERASQKEEEPKVIKSPASGAASVFSFFYMGAGDPKEPVASVDENCAVADQESTSQSKEESGATSSYWSLSAWGGWAGSFIWTTPKAQPTKAENTDDLSQAAVVVVNESEQPAMPK